jgi:ribosomal-protein-alanine N-acetyltransferase
MSSPDITIYTPNNRMTASQEDEIVDFLGTHLEQYGDNESDIRKAIAYAMKDIPSAGGFVLVDTDGEQIVGAVVINETGMGGYIPENILVYIAIHNGYRGQGLGKKMMKLALESCKGDVALHVEPDNPARFLYEKLGFENKYLEMRYKKTAGQALV